MRSMILVLEDDASTSQSISTMIKENFEDSNVLIANNAEAAHEIVKSVRIDLLVSDINLEDPAYTGIDFVKDVLVNNPDLLVIFQSDIDDKDFRLDLHDELEYLSYVTKGDPAYETKLLNKIGRALDIAQEHEVKALVFPSKFSTLSIDAKDLLYVKTTTKRNVLLVGHLSRLNNAHVTDEIYGMTLKGVLEMLGEKSHVLFRVQQGTLLNPSMIKRIDHTAETVSLAYYDLEFTIGREYRKSVRSVLKSLMERW